MLMEDCEITRNIFSLLIYNWNVSSGECSKSSPTMSTNIYHVANMYHIEEMEASLGSFEHMPESNYHGMNAML